MSAEPAKHTPTDAQQRVEPGKYVELGYDLYTIGENGAETLVHQTDADDPERIIFGVTEGMVEPLEKAIEGLPVNGTFDVRATSEQAFGPHDDDQVVTLDREIFLIDGKFDTDRIYPGAMVPMMTADNMRIPGIVTQVTDKHVVMDFNHPLAGKDLRFRGRITAIRDATAEELHPTHGCSGSCCGSQGNCGDGGCGDGGCGCQGGCH